MVRLHFFPCWKLFLQFQMVRKHSFLSLISCSDSQFPVFNVTDCDGNKIRDEGFLNYIQKVSDHRKLFINFLLFIWLVYFKFSSPFSSRLPLVSCESLLCFHDWYGHDSMIYAEFMKLFLFTPCCMIALSFYFFETSIFFYFILKLVDRFCRLLKLMH